MNSKNWWTLIIIIVLIGGSIGGKLLYDAKKERDRQDLIHMGDELDKAWSDYEDSINEIDKNQDIAEEYTNLMESILDDDIASSELEETIIKACEMESKLMELYPTVYNEPSSVCE